MPTAREANKWPEWSQAALALIVLLSSLVNFAVSAYTTKTVLEIKLYVMDQAQTQANRNEQIYTRRTELDSLDKRVTRLESSNENQRLR
jgi:hypothetical protein